MAQQIEVFAAKNPPGLVSHGEIIEAAFIKGNMGGMVVVKLQAGELESHTHEQEHVGVVLEGSFEFVSGDQTITLDEGQIYKIPPHVPHGVRCRNYALIIQARA